MPRNTTRHRRQSNPRVLEVRVMSPRIAWFGFLRVLGFLGKVAFVLAVLGCLGWGAWRGVQHAFYRNPDFRLQSLDLNENPVVDELGVAAAAGIDLTAGVNLFEINIAAAEDKLRGLRALTDVHIERHLPGTLVVRVTARTPKAWIVSPEAGLTRARTVGGLLVDELGIAYPCPERQVAAATALPVVELPASPEHPLEAGTRVTQPELDRCLRLLEAAYKEDPAAGSWIDSVAQANAWSLRLKTRVGTTAVFALGDHERQIQNLRAAMEHAATRGETIETINLIPRHNIPVTFRALPSVPRAIPVGETPSRRR